MNFLLLMYVLQQIIFYVICSVAGAFEISDPLDSFVKLNTKWDDRIKRLTEWRIDIDRRKPAFMAFMQDQPLYRQFSKIVFGDVRLNVNGSYNPVSGVFKVPVTGTYLFSVTLSNESQEYPNYRVVILTDGSQILAEVEYTGKDVFQMRTLTTLVPLLADANVWVRTQHFSMKFAPGKYSFFSGMLVHRL